MSGDRAVQGALVNLMVKYVMDDLPLPGALGSSLFGTASLLGSRAGNCALVAVASAALPAANFMLRHSFVYEEEDDAPGNGDEK